MSSYFSPIHLVLVLQGHLVEQSPQGPLQLWCWALSWVSWRLGPELRLGSSCLGPQQLLNWLWMCPQEVKFGVGTGPCVHMCADRKTKSMKDFLHKMFKIKCRLPKFWWQKIKLQHYYYNPRLGIDLLAKANVNFLESPGTDHPSCVCLASCQSLLWHHWHRASKFLAGSVAIWLPALLLVSGITGTEHHNSCWVSRYLIASFFIWHIVCLFSGFSGTELELVHGKSQLTLWTNLFPLGALISLLRWLSLQNLRPGKMVALPSPQTRDSTWRLPLCCGDVTLPPRNITKDFYVSLFEM